MVLSASNLVWPTVVDSQAIISQQSHSILPFDNEVIMFCDKSITKYLPGICREIYKAEVSPKLSHVDSRNHAQQAIHERFSREFVGCMANGIKIICQCGLGNDTPQIWEGETVAAADFVPTFRDIFQLCAIDPGNGGSHHGKVHMIHDGMGIAGLAFAAADVLFDLDTSAFCGR